MGVLADFFWRGRCGRQKRIVEGVGTIPAQPADGRDLEGVSAFLEGALLDELWRAAEAESVGLGRAEFGRILQDLGAKRNYGLGEGLIASHEQRAAYLRGLKLGDLALARACAAGGERAWERFVAMYRQPLARAAIAMTGSESLGRELADQLYGELFGLTERDGERKCPLASYGGRGSLMGWLRTVLAQRHVDHLRRNRREEPLEEMDAAAPEDGQAEPVEGMTQLEKAIEAALGSCDGEERLILTAYYLDGRTLLEIARVLSVHEATVSRKLKRVCEELRKRVVKNLQGAGVSRRAADEALGADPRDLDVNVKKLLQYSQMGAFKEQAAR
jgi:RNA polymerase sigma-70 factor, ECF subfamily